VPVKSRGDAAVTGTSKRTWIRWFSQLAPHEMYVGWKLAFFRPWSACTCPGRCPMFGPLFLANSCAN
jgi:hypothetical protein